MAARTPDEWDRYDNKPDLRYFMANERTLLAWLRTSLALLGGGIALTQFGAPTQTNILLGIIVLIMSGTMVIVGYGRYLANDRAIRGIGISPAAIRTPRLPVMLTLGFAALLIVIETIRF